MTEPEPAVQGEIQVMRVSGTSKAASLASAVTFAVRADEAVKLRVVGAAAANLALKALAIANRRSAGVERWVAEPVFFDAEFAEGLVTGMELLVTRVVLPAPTRIGVGAKELRAGAGQLTDVGRRTRRPAPYFR